MLELSSVGLTILIMINLLLVIGILILSWKDNSFRFICWVMGIKNKEGGKE